ncbi:MAG TPA: hypothetical protein VJN71_04625 [Nitrososphaerales archaeon]|nr:hypothetical protein [Nitrososphaerales archaeon]
MSALEIISDSENKLLARREVRCIFRGSSGLLTRQGAAEAVATKLGAKNDDVKIISLKGSSGVRDVHGLALIYSDPDSPKRQLPPYLLIRQLPKEERKKVRDELKKAKSAAKSPVGKQGSGDQK